jgi:hypothetical protein
MIRRTNQLLGILGLLVCITLTAPRLAGDDKKTPAPAVATQTDEGTPGLLQGFPQPPEQPANLYQPAPPTPYANEDPMPPRYFEIDPNVDPPWLAPGWFTSVDVTFTVPHVMNKLTNSLQSNGFNEIVNLPSAGLNWTAYPRVEVGYRLPEGFGEFALAYRGLATEGNTTIPGFDGPAALHSKLALNSADFDYASLEFSLLPSIAMKWRVGARFSSIYFDSGDIQSPQLASAGSGVLGQQESNYYWGIGVHAGLELAWNTHWHGLLVVGSTDLADSFGRIRQQYSEQVVTPSPALQATSISSSQDAPSAIGRAGLAWRPPELPELRIFAGYQYEYWWNVGRISLITARGELWDQGVVLQAQYDF